MPDPSLACAAAILILAVDVCTYLFGPQRYYVCFLAVACGCINVCSQKIAGVTTNAVTGNVQKITLAAAEHVLREPLDAASRRDVMITALSVLSFISGVGCSAVAVYVTGAWRMNFAVVALVFSVLLYGHDKAYEQELHERRSDAKHDTLAMGAAIFFAAKLKSMSARHRAASGRSTMTSADEAGSAAPYQALPGGVV